MGIPNKCFSPSVVGLSRVYYISSLLILDSERHKKCAWIICCYNVIQVLLSGLSAGSKHVTVINIKGRDILRLL